MEENKKNKIPNVPNLRFCSATYYPYKIKQICDVVSGGTPDTTNPKYWDGNINWFTPTEVGKTKYVEESLRKISQFGYDKSGAKLLKPGSILLSTRATIGEASICKKDCCTNQGFQSLTNFKCVNEFLYYYLQSYRLHKSLKRRANGSTFLEISNYEVGSTTLYMPDLKAQQQIALFLSKIDQRIETQNKIIDKLESLRVQIKERIFDLGSIKKTISDVLMESNKKSNIQDQYPVLSSTVKGLFLQSDYFDREVASSDNIGYKIVKKGQIIISPQNLWMGNITYNDSFEHGIVSPSYKVFDIKEAYSKIYIYWLLTSKHSLFNYGLVSEQGASIVRRNLNYDSFLNITIPLCNEEQQKHISKLIKSIEAKLKIEKHREELFAKQKNYLLSNLFI